MSEDSVRNVYETILERVGQQTFVSLGVITASDFQRFAIAIDDLNPIYFDETAAKAAGYPTCVAPPTFLTSVMAWGAGPELSSLKLDGMGPDQLGAVPMGDLRLMGAGQDVEFYAPVIPGLDVTMQVEVEDVVLKKGTSGEFLLLTLKREYFTSPNDVICICRENFVGR